MPPAAGPGIALQVAAQRARVLRVPLDPRQQVRVGGQEGQVEEFRLCLLNRVDVLLLVALELRRALDVLERLLENETRRSVAS